MRRVRGLEPKNLKTVKKEVKIRIPKCHVITGYGYDQKTWCGIPRNLIGESDKIIGEVSFLEKLRLSKLSIASCSCCDNKIMTALRQRMLGIE